MAYEGSLSNPRLRSPRRELLSHRYGRCGGLRACRHFARCPRTATMHGRADWPSPTRIGRTVLSRRSSTACRAARRAGTEQARTIVIQGGDYFLDEPVVLTQEDNGLTIEAAAGAKACLYGGREVSGLGARWRWTLCGLAARREGGHVGLPRADRQRPLLPAGPAPGDRLLRAHQRLRRPLDVHHRRRLETQAHRRGADHDEVQARGPRPLAGHPQRRDHGLSHVGRVARRRLGERPELAHADLLDAVGPSAGGVRRQEVRRLERAGGHDRSRASGTWTARGARSSTGPCPART